MREPSTPRRSGARRLTSTLALITVALLVMAAAAIPAGAYSDRQRSRTVARAGTQACSGTAHIAVVGDLPPANDDLAAWLVSQGLDAERVFWEEGFLDNVAAFDLVIFNRQFSPWPTTQEFLGFLADTDSAGAGVVFLAGGSSGLASGIGQLTTHVGNPSSIGQDYSSVSLYRFYDVLAPHPILDGFAVGDRIRFDESSDFELKRVNWFQGYTGNGRQVLGNAGFWFRGDQVKGPGIGAQQRPNNRHALLSLHEISASFGPSEWNDAATRIFLNSLEWTAPAEDPISCP